MTDSKPSRKTRKRTVVTRSWPSKIHWTDGTAVTPYVPIEDSYQQITTSEGHTWPPRGDAKFRDIGGSFETYKREITSTPSRGYGEYFDATKGAKKIFDGYHWYPGDDPYLAERPSNSQLDAWGTTAIARVDPTKSVVDMSVFIGELLREGIPDIPGIQSWQKRSEGARNAGGEYLNYTFGWAPLVSEVRALASVVKDAEGILRQYERDAGKLVRRRYEFPREVENSLSGGTSNGHPLTSHPEWGGGKYVWQTQTVERYVWFSGAFTYWIPADDAMYYKLRKYVDYADKLLGLELTPETLWNLSPWSWAVDWFVNVGDLLHNVSAFDPDRLVMRYGYICCTQKATSHRAWLSSPLIGGDSSGGQWKCERIRKIRRPATPYGFGLNPSLFSTKRWAILAALGISKGPRLL